MATKARRADRQEALSRDSIVNAAIELLDQEGEAGLTFRALATKLATGAGAIYWHVANKDELLVAATDLVVSSAIAHDARDATPLEAIRAVALGMFDAIDDHPWVGAQLSRAPWPSAMLDVFERIGRPVQALGVPDAEQFTAASSLMSYIFGVAGQNAANARMHAARLARPEFLASIATAWAELDADKYAFTRAMAGSLRDHDDRAEFLAGIDLIVAGIAAPRPPVSEQRRGARAKTRGRAPASRRVASSRRTPASRR